MKTFADVLKSEMTARGVTVLDLAKKLGVSDVTVRHWRNGRWLPKLRQAFALARLFKVSLGYLFPDL